MITEPEAPKPTGMVAIMALVWALITETLFKVLLTMYMRLPSGLTDAASGYVPTGIVAITALVAVLITETVFEKSLVI